MANTATNLQYANLVRALGRPALNALYPKDFEHYMVALELVDSSGRMIEYFAFPVTPSSISQTERSLTNIKKSSGGVVTVDTGGFVPIDIEMSGNFGAGKFKALIGKTVANFASLRFSTENGVYGDLLESGQKIKTFDPQIKTGFGSIKVLESILTKSKGLDQYNSPFRLFLYNPAFGDNFVVKVKNHKYNQTESSNFIWNYTMGLVAIARTEQSLTKYRESLVYGSIQSGINLLSDNIKQIL